MDKELDTNGVQAEWAECSLQGKTKAYHTKSIILNALEAFQKCNCFHGQIHKRSNL